VKEPPRTRSKNLCIACSVNIRRACIVFSQNRFFATPSKIEKLSAFKTTITFNSNN
jgi:hypothetical protein